MTQNMKKIIMYYIYILYVYLKTRSPFIIISPVNYIYVKGTSFS